MNNPLLITPDSFDTDIVYLDVNIILEYEINQLIDHLTQSDNGYDNYLADILSKLQKREVFMTRPRIAEMLNEYLMTLLNGENND